MGTISSIQPYFITINTLKTIDALLTHITLTFHENNNMTRTIQATVFILQYFLF